eukprot:scpid64054/ scgid9265/ 
MGSCHGAPALRFELSHAVSQPAPVGSRHALYVVSYAFAHCLVACTDVLCTQLHMYCAQDFQCQRCLGDSLPVRGKYSSCAGYLYRGALCSGCNAASPGNPGNPGCTPHGITCW